MTAGDPSPRPASAQANAVLIRLEREPEGQLGLRIRTLSSPCRSEWGGRASPTQTCIDSMRSWIVWQAHICSCPERSRLVAKRNRARHRRPSILGHGRFLTSTMIEDRRDSGNRLLPGHRRGSASASKARSVVDGPGRAQTTVGVTQAGSNGIGLERVAEDVADLARTGLRSRSVLSGCWRGLGRLPWPPARPLLPRQSIDQHASGTPRTCGSMRPSPDIRSENRDESAWKFMPRDRRHIRPAHRRTARRPRPRAGRVPRGADARRVGRNAQTEQPRRPGLIEVRTRRRA